MASFGPKSSGGSIREQTPWDPRLSAQQRGDRTVLQVESSETDDDGMWQARVPRGARSEELTMLPIAPRVYEATVPQPWHDSFPVTIVKRKDGAVVYQRTETVTVSQAPDAAAAEYRQQPPNRDMLRALAEETGGHVDPDPGELTSQGRDGQRNLLQPLENSLIVTSLIVLLGDIALRVLRGPPV